MTRDTAPSRVRHLVWSGHYTVNENGSPIAPLTWCGELFDRRRDGEDIDADIECEQCKNAFMLCAHEPQEHAINSVGKCNWCGRVVIDGAPKKESGK